MAKIIRLENGVTVVCDHRPGSGKTAAYVTIKTGLAHDAIENLGLTNLTVDAMSGGTSSLSREDISRKIENGGGFFGCSAENENLEFSVTTLSESAEDAFSVLADVILNPSFDPEEIEFTKGQIKNDIDTRCENLESLAGDKLFEAAFPGQSIGFDGLGTHELLDSFTPAQVRARHQQFLSDPSSIVISIAGDMDETTAEKLARAHFSYLAPGTPQRNAEYEFKGGDIRDQKDTNQLNLLFGFKSPSGQDPRRYAYLMMNQILGAGMSSPLFTEIRGKRSLAYDVYSVIEPQEHDGIFYIGSGISDNNAAEFMTAAIKLLGKMARREYTQQELDIARERLVRPMYAAQESIQNVACKNAVGVLFNGFVRTPEEADALFKQVTADDIRAAFADLLRSGTYALGATGRIDLIPSENEIKALLAAEAANLSAPLAPNPITAVPVSNTFNKKDIPREKPQITVLANGIKVVSVRRPGTLACGAWLGVGSAYETPELSGASHMIEHMMFLGTPNYPSGEVSRIVEHDLRGKLNAYTSTDQTCYYFYNLSEDGLEKAIDICGEMVYQANIDEGEYQGKLIKNPDGTTETTRGEREVVFKEIDMNNDDILRRLMYAMNEKAYPGQAQGMPILGTKESLGKISASMMRAYRDKYYSAGNTVFSAAGPIKHEDFVAIIQKKFGHLKNMSTPKLEVPVYVGGTDHFEMEQAQTSNIWLTLKGISNTSPDSVANKALEKILGGGESSPLYTRLVNDLEIASSIGSYAISFINCGLFINYGDVEAKNIRQFLSVIYDELKKTIESLDPADLEKAKRQMRSDFLSAQEINQETCDHYGQTVLAHGRLITPDEYLAQIDAITVDDIIRVGKSILASNPSVSIVVPKGTDKSFIPTHEEIVAMRDKPLRAGSAPALSAPVI